MLVVVKARACSFLEKTFPKILTQAHGRLIFDRAFMAKLFVEYSY